MNKVAYIRGYMEKVGANYTKKGLLNAYQTNLDLPEWGQTVAGKETFMTRPMATYSRPARSAEAEKTYGTNLFDREMIDNIKKVYGPWNNRDGSNFVERLHIPNFKKPPRQISAEAYNNDLATNLDSLGFNAVYTDNPHYNPLNKTLSLVKADKPLPIFEGSPEDPSGRIVDAINMHELTHRFDVEDSGWGATYRETFSDPNYYLESTRPQTATLDEPTVDLETGDVYEASLDKYSPLYRKRTNEDIILGKLKEAERTRLMRESADYEIPAMIAEKVVFGNNKDNPDWANKYVHKYGPDIADIDEPMDKRLAKLRAWVSLFRGRRPPTSEEKGKGIDKLGPMYQQYMNYHAGQDAKDYRKWKVDTSPPQVDLETGEIHGGSRYQEH